MRIYITIALLIIFFCSCSNHQPQPQSGIKKPFPAIGITPRADTLIPARVTFLDTCKPPRVIAVPTKASTLILDTKNGKDTLHLTPPVPKNADFYVTMTTYTAEQGLFSTIACLAKDKSGNLWFGTDGGGVSRYDGKSFITYTTANGLANNLVYSMAEDHKGNLWFGTFGGGVSRYDGKSFTTYTTAQGLANNSIWSVASDRSGNLWFATAGGGVSRYNPSASHGTGSSAFTTYTTAQGLANNEVYSIAEDRSGNLWFGTNGGGVSRYDPSKDLGKGSKPFTTYTTAQGLAGNVVVSIAEDRSGNLWFGTGGGGVSRYSTLASLRTDSPSFTNYTTAQGLASNVVVSIAEDGSGNLWFGTVGGGVSRYDPSASFRTGSPSFTTYTTAQGLANNVVMGIAEDGTGHLWFGTKGGGASRYDAKSFTTYTTSQGLTNNVVYSIAEDRGGKLWFGTASGGVSCYEGNCLKNTNIADKNKVSKSFTTYSSAQGLANNVVFSIVEDRAGYLWFGTQGGGVSRLDTTASLRTGSPAFTTYTTAQGLADNEVHCIAEDHMGILWFGTSGGVSRYDGKSFTTYTTAQGLTNNVVYGIAEDRAGNLWFGTNGGGVSRYDPSASLRKGSSSFTTYTTAQGLANNNVLSIAQDRSGNLWFGTEGGGVSRYDPSATLRTGSPSFSTYTTADGLANNVVYSIAEDSMGNLWFGTNEGFSVLKSFTRVRKEMADKKNDNSKIIPADNKLTNTELVENYVPIFEKYNFKNGYPTRDCNTNALLIDSKGIIWAGTGDKLVRFDYSGIHKDTTQPLVFINAIKIGGEAVCWYDLKGDHGTGIGARREADSMAIINEEVCSFGEVLTPEKRDTMRQKYNGIRFDSIARFYPVPLGLVLPYRHNNITFDFRAVEVARPYLVKYQYILEGYDKDWNPVTDRTTATFGNVNEGTYTFKLRAQNPDGIWSAPMTYIFTVLPPWYRTWWAYLIYILAGFYSLYAIIRWRTSTVKKEKEHLEKVVAERTAQVVEEKAQVAKEKAEVEKQKQRSDELLLNILPEEVAEELKDRGSSAARHYENVTVLFTDFENFTKTSEHMSPQVLIDELHACFKAFDEITDKYGIEKIKTIGDAYMAVAGLPTADPYHAENVVKAAIEIKAYMTNRYKQMGDKTFKLRIGIHSGNVVAGIVGVKKFAYDIWGDTVNTAARMEQNSEAGKINMSQTSYELVKDKFNCEYRGEIEAKGKGVMKMYFVN